MSHSQIPAVKVNYRQKDRTSELCAHPAFVPPSSLPKESSHPYLPSVQYDVTTKKAAKLSGKENNVMTHNTTILQEMFRYNRNDKKVR